MLKLVAALAVSGALAAGVFLLPIRGRTVADRWHAASGARTFAANTWAEARQAFAGDPRRAPPSGAVAAGRPTARDARRADRQPRAPAPGPVEHHTPEDRDALDRLLSERSR